MARTRAAVYQGKLELKQVTGLRADRTKVQPVKIKDTKKVTKTKSMKTELNTGRNGEKYS
jgi:hypothetical protein